MLIYAVSYILLGFILSVSADDKDDFLEMHNRFRSQVAKGEIEGQPPAANMVKMEWDEDIARHAKRWADNCRTGHDSYDERKTDKFRFVGQNWAGGGSFKHGMQMWFDEYKDYTLDSQSCNGVCGHYTQIVWAKSTHLGCAYTKCPSPYRYGLSIVCNYGPAGNFNSQKPYEKGSACSACPEGYDHCVDGLCSKSPGDKGDKGGKGGDKNKGGKDKGGKGGDKGGDKDKGGKGGDKKEGGDKCKKGFEPKTYRDCATQYRQCYRDIMSKNWN